MAETMGAVPTHDDVAFVAREAAAASKSCKVALPRAEPQGGTTAAEEERIKRSLSTLTHRRP